MDSSLSSDGSEDEKFLMRHSKASLPAPPPLRPQIARSTEIDETKLAPLPQKPWKTERFPYGFDDSLTIDDLDVVPSPLGRSDVFDLLHTPVASRRVSLADSHILNHFPISDTLGLDTPQMQRIKVEPEEFRLLELKQTDKMAVETSSTHVAPVVKPSTISEKAERKDIEPTTVTSSIAQENLVPMVQKRLSITSTDASEALQPIENAQSLEKTDPQDQKLPHRFEEKRRKDSISGKPQVRFDPKNLVISEYSPEELSENCKTLVVIGMAKCPETLNHRTWTEKVFPKISVWFGEYKVQR